MFRRLHQSWLLVALCLGIVFGTIFSLIFRTNFFVSMLWMLFSAILFVFAYFRPNYFFLGVIFFVGVLLAFCRSSVDLAGKNYIEQFVGNSVELSGKVSTDPSSNDDTTSFQLSELELNGEKIKGSVFVSLPASSSNEIQRTDNVALSGKMYEGFGNFSGAFYQPAIKTISHAEPRDFFLQLRDWFSSRIKKYIPEKESSLGLAYLLGMKNGLSENLKNILRIVGLTHIVVASGTHLGIIVGITKKLSSKISRFSGLFFSVLFIVIFGSIVGWTASILRASIVTILSLLAWYVGRKFQAWRILLITIATTLLINPMFVTDVGWLLSFASFSGILLFMPEIKKFFFGEKKISKFVEIILATISAQLICIPILLFFFGSISLISPIANILILPTVPIAMGLVFLTGIFSFPVAGDILGLISKILLDYHIFIVNFFANQKFFLVSFGIKNPFVFLFYIPIIAPFLISFIKKLRQPKLT